MGEETRKCEKPPRELHVGVLAIIGSFLEHVNMVTRAVTTLRATCNSPWEKTEVKISVIRRVDEINEALDALIIPGGETTVLSRFLEINNFVEVLKEWSRRSNKFMWGTCAGLIVMSNKVENAGKKPPVLIGGIDITCVRNGYGRQRESHVTELEVVNDRLRNPLAKKLTETGTTPGKFSGVFIRAPVIKSIDSSDVETLCLKSELQCLRDDACEGEVSFPVGVMQKNKMATTFHPELTDDIRWHAFFLVEALKRKYVGEQTV